MFESQIPNPTSPQRNVLTPRHQKFEWVFKILSGFSCFEWVFQSNITIFTNTTDFQWNLAKILKFSALIWAESVAICKNFAESLGLGKLYICTDASKVCSILKKWETWFLSHFPDLTRSPNFQERKNAVQSRGKVHQAKDFAAVEGADFPFN